MSDSEDSNDPPVSARPKKRRTARACDNCHQRKIKCDCDTMPNSVCSNCLSLGIECTHLAQRKKRGPKAKSNQSERMSVQTLITTIVAAPKTVIVPKDEALVRSMLVDLAQYARSLESQLENSRSSSSPPAATSSKSSPVPEQSEDQADYEFQESLTLRVQNLSLDNQLYHRHIGKSSHFMLLQTALDIRDEMGASKDGTISKNFRRTEFWTPSPWHHFRPIPEQPPYEFPEPELLRKLVKVYFDTLHHIFPLLHRPTFEKQVFVDRLHLSSQRFGSVVLAVCALGARTSTPVDPRTLYDGTHEPRSAGWKYISQIRFKTNYTEASTLWDVQLYALALILAFPTPLADIGWPLSGLGIRAAQEVGAHRKGFKTNKPAPMSGLDIELWKRAFWNIITIDLYMSIALGRPRSLREDDFDADLPPECDDEYWDIQSNQLEFIQPVGKVSYAAYWHHYVKLLRIAGLIKDHLFTTRKAAPWQNSDYSISQDTIVMELDSALNSWATELPEYLKWDPHRPDDILFAQTVMLHSNFHWVQIQLHKIFIRPGPGSSGNFPSMAICANAARSYVHMIQTYNARSSMPVLPNYIAPIFVAAIMLLINLWTSLRTKSSYDPRKDMADVYSCMDHLSRCETKYENAGRLRDVLEAVISFSQMPPPPLQKESLKRARPGDFSQTLQSDLDPERMQHDSESMRKFAGSRRVSNSLQSTAAMHEEGLVVETVLSPGSMDPSISSPDSVSGSGSGFDPFHGFRFGVDAPGSGHLASDGPHPHSQAVPSSSLFPHLYPFGKPDDAASMSLDSPIGSGLDDSSIFVPPAWNDPNHEDWTLFMSNVDELLNFVNQDAL